MQHSCIETQGDCCLCYNIPAEHTVLHTRLLQQTHDLSHIIASFLENAEAIAMAFANSQNISL